MAFVNKVSPIPLTSIDSSTFTGAYQLLTSAAGLAALCTQIHIVNNSNVSITISYDGVNDHDFLLAATDRQLNFQNNALATAFVAALAKGTKIYVKGAAGVGLVFLSGWTQASLV